MFKPMLAPGESPATYPNFFRELRYPLLVSPKLDGIRCIVKNGFCMSRSGKQIPSFYAQELFGEFKDFDGELIEGNCSDVDVYNRTQSHVMSRDKKGDLHFHVFDYTESSWLPRPFLERIVYVQDTIPTLKNPRVHFVNHFEVRNEEQLLAFEQAQLELGFEGIMMRSLDGYYKNGRGTFKEGLIYKLKRFEETEGCVVDLIEQLTNNNELTRDELGYAKRSYEKAGMTLADTLGKFVVEFEGDFIEIAPGNFTHAQRKEIWSNKEKFIGKSLKFRYFKHGIKDKPRFPRAVGFRTDL